MSEKFTPETRTCGHGVWTIQVYKTLETGLVILPIALRLQECPLLNNINPSFLDAKKSPALRLSSMESELSSTASMRTLRSLSMTPTSSRAKDTAPWPIRLCVWYFVNPLLSFSYGSFSPSIKNVPNPSFNSPNLSIATVFKKTTGYGFADTRSLPFVCPRVPRLFENHCTSNFVNSPSPRSPLFYCLHNIIDRYGSFPNLFIGCSYVMKWLNLINSQC